MGEQEHLRAVGVAALDQEIEKDSGGAVAGGADVVPGGTGRAELVGGDGAADQHGLVEVDDAGVLALHRADEAAEHGEDLVVLGEGQARASSVLGLGCLVAVVDGLDPAAVDAAAGVEVGDEGLVDALLVAPAGDAELLGEEAEVEVGDPDGDGVGGDALERGGQLAGVVVVVGRRVVVIGVVVGRCVVGVIVRRVVIVGGDIGVVVAVTALAVVASRGGHEREDCE